MRGKILLLVLTFLVPTVLPAQDCTTQSQMTASDRTALADAGRSLALKVQAGDAAGLQAATVPEYAKDFSGIGNVVANTAAKLKGGAVIVQQVYLLDGTKLKPNADGSAPEAQFFCSLNQTVNEVDFLIPGLLPGKYGFVIVDVESASPWQLSFLLRQSAQNQWMMAGFYPKALTAAGHDGLWYWRQARTMAKDNEQWNAWLYYRQAQALLQPVGFIQSTNLQKLRSEQSAAAPQALSGGIGPNTPLVVKGKDGSEYRFTSLGVDDSLGAPKIDVTAHLAVAQIGDAATAKKRNDDAASALLASYPELRKAFHGVWIFAQAPGQNPYATEQAMNEIH
ncbi:MAG TPA: hypothetical protein VFE38_00160 [Edaphobacter sp.]|nr:hypothetical protein [Edaphobacter sp.]